MNTTGAVTLVLLKTMVGVKRVDAFTAEILETLYGESRYLIMFEDRDVDYWNSVAKDGGVSEAQLQITENLPDGNPVESKWKVLTIRGIRCRFIGGIVEVQIVATDSMFRLKNRTPQNVYKDKTVAEVVQQIAEEQALDSDIDEFASGKYTLYQCGMNDYDFIRNVVIPRVGQDPVLFYMEDGATLKFKTRKRLDAAMRFSLDAKGNATSVPLNAYTSVVTIGVSNFGVKAVAFDPLKSQTEPFLKEFLATDATYGKKDPFVKTAPTPISIEGFPSRIQNVVIGVLGLEIDSELKSRVDWDPGIPMYRTAIHSYLLPAAKIGTSAYVDAKTVDGKASFATGDHLVYAVYHRLFPGGNITTTTFLERRGTV